jgi:hypothetical protein
MSQPLLDRSPQQLNAALLGLGCAPDSSRTLSGFTTSDLVVCKDATDLAVADAQIHYTLHEEEFNHFISRGYFAMPGAYFCWILSFHPIYEGLTKDVYLASGLLDEETECFTILYIQILMRQLGIKYSLLDSCQEMAVPTRDFEQLRGKVALNGLDETEKIWGKENVSRNKQIREPIFKTVQDRCFAVASSAGTSLVPTSDCMTWSLIIPARSIRCFLPSQTVQRTLRRLPSHKTYAKVFSAVADCTEDFAESASRFAFTEAKRIQAERKARRLAAVATSNASSSTHPCPTANAQAGSATLLKLGSSCVPPSAVGTVSSTVWIRSCRSTSSGKPLPIPLLQSY